MDTINVVVSIFLATWFITSVLWQFKFDFLERIERFDLFQILPNWTFFAPNPGVSDFHLLFRIVSPNGQYTEWREIPIVQNRMWIHFFWNPEKRKIKLLIDCINGIIIISQKNRKLDLSPENCTKRLCLSVPYILILNAVLCEVNKINILKGSQVQFAIAQTFGFLPREQPRPIIVSPVHSI